ncbi:hypothetical protein [uncultured Helicobacter sp.]|uniref:hypothetical protein n=1 Tax=uncultured Helicobacter sp. TaxID=175537 RepID=UPI00374FAF6B
MGGGAAATIVYLAIFSMESASVLLASFAGCMLLSRVFTAYREHKSLVAALKTRTFFDLCLVAIIILWAIALWQMIHSGRAGYCASFELTRGIAYLDTTLKGIRVGFVQLFVAVYILSLFGAFWIKNPQHRLLLFVLNLWIVCLVVFYTLTTSKCGATWYLMSGLLMAMLVFMAISLSIFVAQYTSSYIIISAFFFIAFFQTLQPYKERPRAAYTYFKSYSQSWIEQMQQAQIEGKTHIEIYVPEHFGHHHWNSWFAPGFSKTLQTYGLLGQDIRVTFKPIITAPKNQYD